MESTNYMVRLYLERKLTDLKEQLQEIDGSTESMYDAITHFKMQKEFINEMIDELNNEDDDEGSDDYA